MDTTYHLCRHCRLCPSCSSPVNQEARRDWLQLHQHRMFWQGCLRPPPRLTGIWRGTGPKGQGLKAATHLSWAVNIQVHIRAATPGETLWRSLCEQHWCRLSPHEALVKLVRELLVINLLHWSVQAIMSILKRKHWEYRFEDRKEGL